VNKKEAIRDSISQNKSSDKIITSDVQDSMLARYYSHSICWILKRLKFCKYNFYVDDLLIYMHSDPRHLSDTIRLVNKDISNIID